VAFRVTDADVARACTIGNRAVASRGSCRLSPRRKSKEPLSRRVVMSRLNYIIIYISLNQKSAHLLYFVLLKSFTHVQQVVKVSSVFNLPGFSTPPESLPVDITNKEQDVQ